LAELRDIGDLSHEQKARRVELAGFQSILSRYELQDRDGAEPIFGPLRKALLQPTRTGDLIVVASAASHDCAPIIAAA